MIEYHEPSVECQISDLEWIAEDLLREQDADLVLEGQAIQAGAKTIRRLLAENNSLREQRDELISIADHYTEFGMSEILELAGIDDTVSTQE